MSLEQDREKFVEWLSSYITKVGRGDDDQVLNKKPQGIYWLGRLQPVAGVLAMNIGDRGERLEPCAMGFRFMPKVSGPWKCFVNAKMKVWMHDRSANLWNKSVQAAVELEIEIPNRIGTYKFGQNEIGAELLRVSGVSTYSAEISIEVAVARNGINEIVATLVNTSPILAAGADTRIYECFLEIKGIETIPYQLESLEDSFRYDRSVPAYGINCGVDVQGGTISTIDSIISDRMRPEYWGHSSPPPVLRFKELASDPIRPATDLLNSLIEWGNERWSDTSLRASAQAEGWSDEMLRKAIEASEEFQLECKRIKNGIDELKSDPVLLRAFKGMNLAMIKSSRDRYDSWRPFQFGFLLANLSSISDKIKEPDVADVVWFATGGGKTETYLGLLLTAILYERINGKTSGVTAWSRFPLRMLSLQQTQRFADALGAAELVKRELGIPGDPFSLGFFVGSGATPNRIPLEPKPDDPDPDDLDMPEKYRTLDSCPFCGQATIKMKFSRKTWRLAHCCTNDECPWPDEALPIFVVDEEIYRFLPTIIVGTLDKAASISLQGSMVGLVGAPRGICDKAGHGFTYAPRSGRLQGCLVPGCTGTSQPLTMAAKLFGPSFRLQDELHLLRDSLGAVDSHYESLYDALQFELCGTKPKVLASSATLTGYQKQIDVLYQRKARVFPVPPPKSGLGFWTSDSDRLMRKFVAVAPKGVTIEYTVDKILSELQSIIRRMVENPEVESARIGVDPGSIPDLVSLFGTDVVYGNTLRDLEAVKRSSETQLQIPGTVNTASLTGKTEFTEVRDTLSRLEEPESDFYNRLHILTASSMMSHGVDIDRLNVMVMLGLPLATAEFIQATARVGRRYPSIVFVVHKIGRERDAGIYRSFHQFITQGDRFVDPIPVTRRSRRVLEKTIAGLLLARILAIHEPRSGTALSTTKSLREYVHRGGMSMDQEKIELVRMLNLNGSLEESMKKDLEDWVEEFWRNIESPPADATFPKQLSPTGEPMRSLRDVEKQVPIYGSRIERS
jgi:hypothetical protein